MGKQTLSMQTNGFLDRCAIDREILVEIELFAMVNGYISYDEIRRIKSCVFDKKEKLQS